MDRPHKVRRTIGLALAIVANLCAGAIWLFRPRWLYADLLDLPAGQYYTPAVTVRRWIVDRTAPWTPTGFLSRFEPEELLIPAAASVGLCVLAVALIVTWSPLPTGSESVPPRRRWPLGRIRVRTALAAVGVVGLYLGWELDAWRIWRAGEMYRSLARSNAEQERQRTETAQRLRAELAALDANAARGTVEDETPEARAARLAFQRDRLTTRLAEEEVMLPYLATLRRKYERAAAHPRRPLPPDPPRPRPKRGTMDGVMEDDARNLEVYAKQIRHYPALASAHQQRAWLLATSPHPELRDGAAAIESAMRAFSLTNGLDFHVLEALAAAYAEAGKFERAAQWQQKALERIVAMSPDDGFRKSLLKGGQARLVLYKAGKPFRHRHGPGLIVQGSAPPVPTKAASTTVAP